MARRRYVSILNPETWGHDRSIKYEIPGAKDDELAFETVDVKNVPWMRGKIVMDREGFFYIYISKRRRWNKVGHGIFCLYRLICHMIDTHRREIPQLRDIEKAIKGLDVELHVLKAPEDDRFGQGEYIQGVLSAQVSMLSRAIDEDKGDARSFMVCMMTMHGLGEGQEIKPVVLRCLSEKARDGLLRRLLVIKSMHPHLCYYRTAIIKVIMLLEDQLAQALTACESLQRYLNQDVVYFPSLINQRIDELHDQILLMQIKPYSHIPRYALDEIARLRQIVDRVDSIKEARSVVRRIHSGLEIMQLRRDLELAALHIDHAAQGGGHIDPRFLNRILLRLGRVRARAQEIDESGFVNPVCGQIFSELELINTRIRFSVECIIAGEQDTSVPHLKDAAEGLKKVAQLI